MLYRKYMFLVNMPFSTIHYFLADTLLNSLTSLVEKKDKGGEMIQGETSICCPFIFRFLEGFEVGQDGYGSCRR